MSAEQIVPAPSRALLAFPSPDAFGACRRSVPLRRSETGQGLLDPHCTRLLSALFDLPFPAVLY